jgi:S1-C subfamily serine protease
MASIYDPEDERNLPPAPVAPAASTAPGASTPPPDAQPTSGPDEATTIAGPGSSSPTPPSRERRRVPSQWLVAAIAALVTVTLLVAGAWALGSRSATGAAAGSTGAGVVVPPAAQDLQQTLINVVHAVQPSVVQVTSSGAQGEAIGSGEILTSDGYIVTNNHVVSGFTSFKVTLASGKTLPAHLVGGSPQDDLAVLKVGATGLHPIIIGSSHNVQVGQFALAMGSPLGLEQSATQGIISALNRAASEGQGGPTLVGLIQTSAPINPGNSGGALVDLQGHLIGVPTLGAANPESGTAAAGIGFAIPSDRVKFVTDQLIKHGRVVTTGQGFLGIRGMDVTPEIASAYNLPVQSGVLVTGFTTTTQGHSPAQAAGLQNEDIIVAVNGQQITNQQDLAGILLTQPPGAKVQVTVQRGATQRTIPVTLGERPANTQG